MRVRIFTNEVAGGWHADDLKSFLGGSEECVVLFAQALAKSGYDVYVYHTFPEGYKTERYVRVSDNFEVKYAERHLVQCRKGDILITFKDRMPWSSVNGEQDAAVRIHWSSEVEAPWKSYYFNNIHAFVCLSPFHASRMVFVPDDKKIIIPHGIDCSSLEKNKTDKINNTILYCSSPDRGLIQLLTDWKIIKSEFNDLKLRVAYGFKNVERMSSSAQVLKSVLMHQMKQEDVLYLGELSKDALEQEYYKAQYWILPLNHPESELFCLNAVKSKLAGCVPIVNRIGALKDTVGDHIPYNLFVNGNLRLKQAHPTYDSYLDWDDIVKTYWVPLFETILKKGHI